jgi:prevent-host-death family protein
MKKASITETKNRLSAFIDAVRHGESVLIMDRNKPVARLEPVSTGETEEPDGYLSQLERSGIIRRRGTKPSQVILRRKPPKAKDGASIVHALIKNREEER